MAGDEAPKTPVGERFPDLKDDEEADEKAKLHQAQAEAVAATVKSLPPSFDATPARDTTAFGDKTTGLAAVLVQQCTVTLADDIADHVLDAARRAAAEGAKNFRIRVTTDPAVFKDVDAYRVLSDRLESLTKRLDEYVEEAEPARVGEFFEEVAAGSATPH